MADLGPHNGQGLLQVHIQDLDANFLLPLESSRTAACLRSLPFVLTFVKVEVGFIGVMKDIIPRCFRLLDERQV